MIKITKNIKYIEKYMKGKVIIKEDITKYDRYTCIKHSVKKILM